MTITDRRGTTVGTLTDGVLDTEDAALRRCWARLERDGVLQMSGEVTGGVAIDRVKRTKVEEASPAQIAVAIGEWGFRVDA